MNRSSTTVDQQLFDLPDVKATESLGRTMSDTILKGVVFLQGELGVGKTTLVRSWLRALGYHGTVASPTYTIVEEYTLNGVKILHIDLYRLADSYEIEYIGILEQIDRSDLQLIEWPEQGRDRLPTPDVIVNLVDHLGGRKAIVRYFNAKFKLLQL